MENKKAADQLKVGGQPVDRYIANFNWEHAKYPQRRTLPELVALIQVGREGGRAEGREGEVVGYLRVCSFVRLLYNPPPPPPSLPVVGHCQD